MKLGRYGSSYSLQGTLILILDSNLLLIMLTYEKEYLKEYKSDSFFATFEFTLWHIAIWFLIRKK